MYQKIHSEYLSFDRYLFEFPDESLPSNFPENLFPPTVEPESQFIRVTSSTDIRCGPNEVWECLFQSPDTLPSAELLHLADLDTIKY